MQLDVLRKEPYNFNADKEYYNKGYRSLIGVPGRVIQAKELTALAMYPIFALNDIAEELFPEGIVQGFDVSNDSKLENGSIFGMSSTDFTNLLNLKIVEILENGNETEIDVDLNDLDIPPVIVPPPPEEPIIQEPEELSDKYNVKIIPHDGEDLWPSNIL